MEILLKTTAFYVSSTGNDNNDGTKDAPFLTLERARDAVSILKKMEGLPEGGVRVYLRQGVYHRDGVFELTENDSGQVGAPVIYTGYPGEKVTITGGVELNGNAFTKLTDTALLSRLPQECIGKIYAIDLKTQGITKILSPKATMQAMFNDSALSLARWPNEGYYEVPTVVSEGARSRMYEPDKNPPFSPDYIPPEKQSTDPGVIKYAYDRIDLWSNLEDIYAEGYWGELWSTDILKIAKRDNKEKTLTFNRCTKYGVKQDVARFYAFNIFEEIDMPGEYYIDKDLIMYLYPPADMTDAKIEITQFDQEFINMQNVTDVAFCNIHFKSNEKAAILLKGGKNVSIHECQFSNIHDAVIQIQDTYDTGVTSCSFKNIGGKGIDILSGDRNTLTPANIFVENCYFNRFSQILKTYNGAIHPSGVGIRISHCVFHDAPHTAVLFNGNDMLIEYNEMYDLVKETDDAGAIYSGRDATWRGNVIRYNYIHDINCSYGKYAYGRSGVYMDDAMSAMTTFGCIFNNVQRAFHMGGGRDHTISNNIFYNVENPILFDARESHLLHDHLIEKETTHIISLRFRSVPYDSEIWKSRYPEVYAMSLDHNPGYPKGNIISNNIYVDCGKDEIYEPVIQYAKQVENNLQLSEEEAALCFSPDKHHVTIPKNSEIYKRIPAFSNIPTDKIGQYTAHLNQKLADIIALKINSPYALVNGQKYFVDKSDESVCPQLKNNTIWVPAAFIVAIFGELGVEVPQGNVMVSLDITTARIGKKLAYHKQGLVIISDRSPVFNEEEDAYLINETIRKLTF